MIHKTNTANTYSGANNNIDFTYYSSMSNIDADYTFECLISKISINTHVDRLNFSCFYHLEEAVQWVFQALDNKLHGYSCTKDGFVQKGIYTRKRIYIHNKKAIKITILYKRRNPKEPYLPAFTIILDDPDIGSINWLYNYCDSSEFTTTLSYVELAIDYSPPVSMLKEYFSRNLVLKNHRGSCQFVDGSTGKNKKDKPVIIYSKDVDDGDSFYIGHKKKNSKSIVLYPKEIDDDNVLRLEFRLKRNFLKRIGVELDCFININNIDLSKLVSFKKLNHDKLIKYIEWKLKKVNGNDRQLIKEVRKFTKIGNVAMKQIKYLKQNGYKSNYQRFFEDITDVNDAFYGRLKGAKFI